MQILELLCPDLASTTQRNARTEGSHPLLRPDATYGQPPIVLLKKRQRQVQSVSFTKSLQEYLSILAYHLWLVLQLLVTKSASRQLVARPSQKPRSAWLMLKAEQSESRTSLQLVNTACCLSAGSLLDRNAFTDPVHCCTQVPAVHDKHCSFVSVHCGARSVRIGQQHR